MADDKSAVSVSNLAMPVRIGPKKPIRVFLAAWREHQKLTQQEVADRIGPGGIHKGTVSRWENAKRAPSLNVLAAYAEAINRPISDLYRMPHDEPSLDAMVAEAPKDIRDKAADIVRTLVGKAAA